MLRLMFTKTGQAVWISHLDTMRLFQRAFKRAGLMLKHTQGFNPRPSVSIALPLSVGVESFCELLDFELEGPPVCADEIKERLNRSLIPGVHVDAVYDDGQKLKVLKYLLCSVFLTYDNGFSQGTDKKLLSLFQTESLLLEKKGKNGVTQQDIIPMIRELTVSVQDERTIVLQAMICCQDPVLNPAQLLAAVNNYLPSCRPDMGKCRRVELYTADGNVFR